MHNNSRGRGWNGKRGSFGRGGNNSMGAKKFRGDDDMDEGDDFDSQLATMVDDGDDMQQDIAHIEEAEELVEDMEVDRITRWKRPAAPRIDPANENFVFQQIDIDNYIGKPIPGMPGAQTYINPDGDFVDSHAVAKCEVKESWHFSTPSKSPTQSTRR